MNRRNFIQSVGLLTGSAFIALKANALSPLGTVETITGKVTDGKKGLANVAISDGYSVVLTDAKGKYSLTSNTKAGCIFMSTPAGYEFKTDYNVARQYENIGNKNSFDFKLQPLKRNDDNHHFIIWADPQVKNKKDVQQMMDTSVPDTIETIKSLGKDALVHGICVGDIVWDNHELFPDYNAAVAKWASRSSRRLATTIWIIAWEGTKPPTLPLKKFTALPITPSTAVRRTTW
nr:metallophosphoesterase N-terminal domain-containing protein [uncultured Mucilaginibacter sp.]